MKKKMTGILIGVLYLSTLIIVLIMVGSIYKYIVNALEDTQTQIEMFGKQLDSLETDYVKLKKSVSKLSKKEKENSQKEQTVNSAEEITNLQVGSVIDASQITATDLSQYFRAYEIIEGDAVYNRIIGKSYQINDNVALSDLRYLKVLHYNFDAEVQVGELIVNAKLAEDFLNAFKSLYEYQYQIQSMYLIDNYWTGNGASSDNASIDVNNTSAFCYRVATNSSNLSKHAYGCAIDINSQQNPYVTYDASGKGTCYHENAIQYVDRSSGLAHVITHEDICYQVFTELGFKWGGDWTGDVRDFQHFEKVI